MIEDELGGVHGLGQLLAPHRAGRVEHEHDVARDGGVHVDHGREQQREVAILAGHAVDQQAGVDETLTAAEVEPEVGVRGPALGGLPAQLEAAGRDALGVEIEARRERGAHLPGHVDVDGDDGARGARRHPRPGDLDQRLITLGEQRGGDGEADLALLARRDGEGADLVEVVAEGAQQRRVDQPAHDLLVDAGGLVGVEDPPFEGLGSAREQQVGDRAAGRDGEDDAALGVRTHEVLVRRERVAEHEAVVRDHHAVPDLDLGLQRVELGDAADGPPAVEAAGPWRQRVDRMRLGGRLLRAHRRRHQDERDEREREEAGGVSHGFYSLAVQG